MDNSWTINLTNAIWCLRIVLDRMYISYLNMNQEQKMCIHTYIISLLCKHLPYNMKRYIDALTLCIGEKLNTNACKHM